MGMKKRLDKAISKFGQYDDDTKSLAEHLIRAGWRDTEKRAKVQHITVVPAPVLPQVTQIKVAK